MVTLDNISRKERILSLALIISIFFSGAIMLVHGQTYSFAIEWGSLGSVAGQFHFPNGEAVDASGNVYVVDTYNHRVQKFSSSGVYETEWGTFGSDVGQLKNPLDCAVDSSGNIYVSDSDNSRVQKFSSSGVYITQFGSYGSDNGQFKSQWGIAVDVSGNIYVVDTFNFRVEKFDSSGNFLVKWGSDGFGDGEFSYPYGIAVDGSGNVYVADNGNNRVEKFDSNGNFLGKWGSYGSDNFQFKNPCGVAVDGSGNVYVADNGNGLIKKFDSSGNFLTKWGSWGSGEGQFTFPRGLAVDDLGNVYVTDSSDRVQKFALNIGASPTQGPITTSMPSSSSSTFVPTQMPVSTGTPSTSLSPSSSSTQPPAPSKVDYFVPIVLVFGVVAPILGFALVFLRRRSSRLRTTIESPGVKSRSITLNPDSIVTSNSFSQIFISHVEEDSDVAKAIAKGLEKVGFKTWYYERDSFPGQSYILTTSEAIEKSKAVILVLSRESLRSNQIHAEVIAAHEAGVHFVPVLNGIKHEEFQQSRPEWRRIIGSSTSVSIPREGVSSIIPRMIAGLTSLGVTHETKSDSTKEE
jgi:sugar lactone lactonase YvrE